MEDSIQSPAKKRASENGSDEHQDNLRVQQFSDRFTENDNFVQKPESSPNPINVNTNQSDATNENNNQNEPNVVPVEVLLEKGESQSTVDKLKAAGIYSLESLAMSTKNYLMSIKGISEMKATTLLEKSSRVFNHSPIDGSQLLLQEQNQGTISTGSKDFDKLLDGGISCGHITELVGEYRTGKTQICMTLSTLCQLSEQSGKAFYIDTYGKFSASRFASVAEQHNCEVQTALKNLAYMRVYNHEQLFEVVSKFVPKYFIEAKYSLLVVDSIINLYLAEFPNENHESPTHMKNHLRAVLQKLNEIATIHNVAVVITNEVEEYSPDVILFKSGWKKPLGTDVLAHAVHTRVQLRKGRGETRIAKIISAPNLPDSEAAFAIGSKGIQDSEF